MRHFLIYGLAAVLIFTMLGKFAAVETVVAAEKTAAPMAAVAKMAVLPEEGGAPEEEQVVLAGLLQVNMSSMDDMYFKNALLEELGEGFSVHALSTSDTGDQPVMFRKMVEKGYRLIVVELYDTALVDEYIDLAEENGVSLIFTGEEPSAEQMARKSDLYYVGFSEGNVMRELADAIIQGWKNNQAAFDLKSDDRLIYGIFTKDSYEENGNQETLDRYLSDAGLTVEMGRQCVTSAFNFNLKKEVDNILYAGGEMIICDSSSYARQISDYLHDPDEFVLERLINTRIYLTVADEGAQKMVEEGTAMFATGINGGDTGIAVGKLAKALVAGEKPTAETVGIAPDQNKRLYITNRTVTSDLIRTRVAEDDEEE